MEKPLDEKGNPKEGKLFLEEYYHPSQEIQEAIFDVYEKLLRWRSLREQGYKQFNGKTLLDWLQESREKYWGYLPLSFDLDVPQFFVPETRNQVNHLLAKVANLRMKPSFEGVEDFDIVKATILKDFFEYWRRSSNKKIKNFWAFLYTVINGTCIEFVGYKSKNRKVKDITMFDPISGEVEWKDRDDEDSDAVEVLCNLEDIYIPKLWEPDIQEQDELIWRTLMKWSDFKNAFSGYELADYVFPGMQFADQSIFSQFLAYDVKGSDFVEVIRYFNAPKDRYMIIANGVLMNPVKQKGKRDEILSPLPWNHKKLPFAKTILEPLDPNFFYGMTLPQKVKTPQEALNKMTELQMEREIRSVAAPIITTDNASELGLEFKAGQIYQVGVPVDQYKELSVQPSTPALQNLIIGLNQMIDRAGSGTSYTTVSKQPRSATEKAQQSMETKEAVGLPQLFYQDLIEQVSWLVIQNMIQFYTARKTNKILGDRKFKKVLNMINVQLAQGGVGNRYVRITENPASADDLKNEAWYRSMFSKERAEIIEVSPAMLRQLRFDIKIDFEKEEDLESERALWIDYSNHLVNTYGPMGLIDMKKMLFRDLEKFGENIADFIPDQLVAEYEKERFGMPVPQQPQQMPQVDNNTQQRLGMQNGSQGPAAQMQQQVGASPLQNQTRPGSRVPTQRV